jgi:signal transduction histidine kinase
LENTVPHRNSAPASTHSSVVAFKSVAGTNDLNAFGPRSVDLVAPRDSTIQGNDIAALAGASIQMDVAGTGSLVELDTPGAVAAEWLLGIAERFPNGSINIFDSELRYLFAEGEGLRAAGLSPGALVGKRLADIFSTESVAYVEPFYRRAFEGESVRFELPVFDRVYSIAAGPVTTHGSTVTRIIAVAQDITDMKSREAAVFAREHAARELAERANRAKDDFLSVVSHELRTPINAILGWSELLTMMPTGSDAARAVAAIRRSASHQSRLIEGLLDASQVATGTMRLARTQVRIRELLMAVIEAVLPLALTKEVRIECAYADDSETVDGDRERLHQVLSNILVNAVKFTPAGGSVRVEGQATVDSVEVRIADTGLGIAAEFLPAVFDRFVKMERFKQEPAGLGLGLALAQDIITAHAGTITAHSGGIGHGTTMTVRLPRVPPRPQEQVPRRATAATLHAVGTLEPRGQAQDPDGNSFAPLRRTGGV